MKEYKEEPQGIPQMPQFQPQFAPAEGQPIAPVPNMYGYQNSYPPPPQGYYQQPPAPMPGQSYPPGYYYGPPRPPAGLYNQAGIPAGVAVMDYKTQDKLMKKQMKVEKKKRKKEERECWIYTCLCTTLCVLCMASSK